MSYLEIGLNTSAVFIDQSIERARLYRAQNFPGLQCDSKKFVIFLETSFPTRIT